MSDLWDNATRDIERERDLRTMTEARAANAETWHFLAQATSERDFENRLALVRSRIEAPEGVQDALIEGWRTTAARVRQASAITDQMMVWSQGAGPKVGDTWTDPSSGKTYTVTQVTDHTISLKDDEGWEMSPQRPFNNPDGSPTPHWLSIQGHRKQSRFDDVVAYTYRADIYTPEGVIEALIADGKASPGARGMDPEDAIRQIVESNGFDYDDLSSFDSDEYPKPIFSLDLEAGEQLNDGKGNYITAARRKTASYSCAECKRTFEGDIPGAGPDYVCEHCRHKDHPQWKPLASEGSTKTAVSWNEEIAGSQWGFSDGAIEGYVEAIGDTYHWGAFDNTIDPSLSQSIGGGVASSLAEAKAKVEELVSSHGAQQSMFASRKTANIFGPSYDNPEHSPDYDQGYTDATYHEWDSSYNGNIDYGRGFNDGTDDRPDQGLGGPSAAGDGWAAYDDPDAFLNDFLSSRKTAGRFGYDLVWGEDWGHGYDEQSGYDYASPEAAFEYAVEALRKAEDEGRVDGPSGIYIYEEEGEDGSEGRGYSWSPQVPGTLYGMDSATPDIDLGMMPMGKVSPDWKGYSAAKMASLRKDATDLAYFANLMALASEPIADDSGQGVSSLPADPSNPPDSDAAFSDFGWAADIADAVPETEEPPIVDGKYQASMGPRRAAALAKVSAVNCYYCGIRGKTSPSTTTRAVDVPGNQKPLWPLCADCDASLPKPKEASRHPFAREAGGWDTSNWGYQEWAEYGGNALDDPNVPMAGDSGPVGPGPYDDPWDDPSDFDPSYHDGTPERRGDYTNAPYGNFEEGGPADYGPSERMTDQVDALTSADFPHVHPETYSRSDDDAWRGTGIHYSKDDCAMSFCTYADETDSAQARDRQLAKDDPLTRTSARKVAGWTDTYEVAKEDAEREMNGPMSSNDPDSPNYDPVAAQGGYSHDPWAAVRAYTYGRGENGEAQTIQCQAPGCTWSTDANAVDGREHLEDAWIQHAQSQNGRAVARRIQAADPFSSDANPFMPGGNDQATTPDFAQPSTDAMPGGAQPEVASGPAETTKPRGGQAPAVARRRVR